MRHLLLSLTLLAALGGCSSHSAPASSDVVVVDGANPGAGAKVKVGQRLVVRLAGNMTTGFAWTCTDPVGATVTADGEPGYETAAAAEGVAGAGGTHTFAFKAVSAGSRELHFAFARSWEKDVPPAKTAVVPVTVE